MKVFIAFSTLLAVASANPLYLAPPGIIVPAASSQYHSQDGTGGYVYGYNNPLSSKQELKSLDGTTKGSYSYVDSNNVLQTVSYIADADGFRVVATNLPKPVEAPIVPAYDLPQQVAETPEVAAARSAHLAAHDEALQLLRSINSASVPTDLPQQVQDTPEVAAAKAAHLAAIEEAKERLGVLHNVPITTDLPQQVQDTPEVAAAKAAHLAAIEEAKRQIGYQVIAIPLPTELPRPVVDTPEVAKAKAEHLLAVEQAKLQSAPLSVPLLPRGFSYSSSIMDGPLPQYGFAQYLRYQV